MAKKKTTRKTSTTKKSTGRSKAGATTADYRHPTAKRKNNPPAKIAAEGAVPVIPKAKYHYNPHLPPVLRFDPDGSPDALPELLEKAKHEPLSDEEASQLAEALRHHQPWLEWANKREEHERASGGGTTGGFEVDPIALHIHERISAQAILNVAARQDVQRSLFADPHQEYHEAVQFYKHDIDWTNRMILGDSLQVMSSLARREDLAGKVQMIYIDPPYGIKFASNFQPEVGRRDVKDKESDLTREPEMVKAYRDTWHLGIHSYLSYLRDRLIVARGLLADTGSIFVQISDENLHRVRQVMDEVFGYDNCVAMIAFAKTSGQTSTGLASVADYLLWYCKDPATARFRSLVMPRTEGDVSFSTYRYRENESGHLFSSEDGSAAQPLLALSDMTSQTGGESSQQDFLHEGITARPKGSRGWRTNEMGLRRLARAGRLYCKGSHVFYRQYLQDAAFTRLNSLWTDTQMGGFLKSERRVYVVQTATRVIERCMLMATEPGDLVLDPTCGSGTTAAVAEQWGRRWITIDTSRVAIALARQRVLTAKFDRYRIKGEDEHGNGNGEKPSADPDAGFVYKTVPHITLKSIAQNQNLDPIFAKWEPILDERLEACNTALSQVDDGLRTKLASKVMMKQKQEGKRAVTEADRRRWLLPPANRGDEKERRKKAKDATVDLDLAQWQHWEVPFDTDPDWPKALQDAVKAYRESWRGKMDEVNQCIVDNADQEELVDQPEKVPGVVRVSGPFTVEAVQPPEMSLGDVVELSRDREGTEPGFGGAPDELDETFEARFVEPRPDMDVQNVEAYLDQMVRLLRTDGVRFPNNKENRFTRLERLESSGPGLHAEGRWVPVVNGSGGNGSGSRTKPQAEDDDPEGRAFVAVAFGPQYGPVTAKMVEDCVRSANRMGYDELVIAGFSFDGAAQTVIEEAAHPKLRIHAAHIRPDVNPGMEGLLKEQPGSQLFTVFGQPRTRLEGPNDDGEYRVIVEGVDIYNPMTNEVSSAGADKIAAWFVDSNYDGRTFCVTQAFFPDRTAWQKLGRALKGVIDEDAFEALSGTESLPFPPGSNGCVAVKVIDPRGNEVMRVHGV